MPKSSRVNLKNTINSFKKIVLSANEISGVENFSFSSGLSSFGESDNEKVVNTLQFVHLGTPPKKRAG